MPSTTGAKPVEKYESFCEIRQISCKYVSRGKPKESVLYHSNGLRIIEKTVSVGMEPNDGTMKGYVSNDYGQYYLISNHDGVEVEITCDTNTNICDDDNHKKVEIQAPDVLSESNEITTKTRKISEKKLKVYYYDLCHRAVDWAVRSPICISPAGFLAGEFADLISLCSYILLPELKDKVVYNLQYQDCVSNPNILLNVYPDIKYSIEIGYKGFSRELDAGTKPTDSSSSSNFSFHFDVTYGSIKKEIDYETFESLEKKAKNNLLYRTLRFIGRFLYDTGNFAESLSKEVESLSGDKPSNVAIDLGSAAIVDKVAGASLMRARRWLSGSFSLYPQFSFEWCYDTSDDLRQLLRHFALSLSAECKGELKIDLIELSRSGVNKIRKVTTAGAVVVTVGSGGLGAILAVLLKLLVDMVVEWLIKKVTEGLRFNLLLIGKVDVTALSYDSLRDVQLEGLQVIINPEIKLELGVDVKSSITLYIIKVYGGVGAVIEASTSLKWQLSLSNKESDLGIDHDMKIMPFTIKIGVYAVGGYEISISKSKPVSDNKTENSKFGYKSSGKKEWSKEWSMEPIVGNIDRWVLFEYDQKDSKGPKGGGGGGSW